MAGTIPITLEAVTPILLVLVRYCVGKMSKGRKFVLMTLALADNTWKKLVTGNDLRNWERQSGLARL